MTQTTINVEGESSADVQSPNETHHLKVAVRILPGEDEIPLKIPPDAPLLKVLTDGAHEAGYQTLPPHRREPFDTLHDILKDGVIGPVIEDLEEPIGEYLERKKTTPNFGIQLALTIRVNTRWAKAPKHELSPRQILELPGIDLKPADWTLYKPGSSAPLPPDAHLKLHRGEHFEAQRDGKYGEH